MDTNSDSPFGTERFEVRRTFTIKDSGNGPVVHDTTATASFTAKMTPEAAAMFRSMFGNLPSACPSCGFTHASDLWRLVGNSYECMRCGCDIEWPDHVG